MQIDDITLYSTLNIFYVIIFLRNSFMGQCVCFYNRIPVREFSILRFKKLVNRRLCVKGFTKDRIRMDYQINDFVNDNTPWE